MESKSVTGGSLALLAD